MATHNDITGDALKTKAVNDLYRTAWDRIFANKEEEENKEESVIVKPSPYVLGDIVETSDGCLFKIDVTSDIPLDMITEIYKPIGHKEEV